MLPKIRVTSSTILCMCLFLAADLSCISENEPSPFECSSLVIEVPNANKVNPTNCTSTDGSITAVASGGDEPYEFSINNGPFQAASLFSNLGTGSYTITVRDINKCKTTLENIALANITSTLSIAEANATNSGCKTSGGTIAVTASGGEAPYEYSIDGTTFGTTSTIASLASGTYTVTVRDAAGCVSTRSNIKVISGISYNTQIKPILQTNCIKSGCHDGASLLPNWSNLAEVQSKAAIIKTKVLNGSMPKDQQPGGLPQAQRDLIACWVDDGALNN